MVKQWEFLQVYGDIPSNDGQILFWSILLLDLYSGLRVVLSLHFSQSNPFRKYKPNGGTAWTCILAYALLTWKWNCLHLHQLPLLMQFKTKLKDATFSAADKHAVCAVRAAEEGRESPELYQGKQQSCSGVGNKSDWKHSPLSYFSPSSLSSHFMRTRCTKSSRDVV